MTKPIEEYEADLLRESWSQQVTRRDSIRGTLAVPIAAIGFAAFGFNGLAGNASVNWAGGFGVYLTVAGLLLALASALSFLVALINVVFRFDFSSTHPEPRIEDLDKREMKVSKQLYDAGYRAERIPELARKGAFDALNLEYRDRITWLRRINDANLKVQKYALWAILVGLALLIFSILSFGMLRLLDLPQPATQSTTLILWPRCLIFCS